MKIRPRWCPELSDAKSRARAGRGLAFSIGAVALLTVWGGSLPIGRPMLVALFGLLFLLQLRDAKPGQWADAAEERTPWDTRLAETLSLLAGMWVVVSDSGPGP